MDSMEQSLEEDRSVQETTSLKFHLFPRLPKEIQASIWNFSIQSRLLPLASHVIVGAGEKLAIDLGKYKLVPPLLHACRESRVVALKVYTLLPLGNRQVFLNPGEDTLLWLKSDNMAENASRFSSMCSDFSFDFIAISKDVWEEISQGILHDAIYREIRSGVHADKLCIFSGWDCRGYKRFSRSNEVSEKRPVVLSHVVGSKPSREKTKRYWKSWDEIVPPRSFSRKENPPSLHFCMVGYEELDE